MIDQIDPMYKSIKYKHENKVCNFHFDGEAGLLDKPRCGKSQPSKVHYSLTSPQQFIRRLAKSYMYDDVVRTRGPELQGEG